ncbi:MAG TPA: 2Fe-2S iron-sulfur cluster-binding protein, partial [bacterium]|nr:2Fe-2S iron-sulfur cluster-binding protein [bacterium]
MSIVVRLTLNGREVQAQEGETILSVAGRSGISIPTLCFLEGRSRLESCGVCVVEVEGQSSLVPSCAFRVTDAMVVRTDTPTVVEARRKALELLLSDHVGDCCAPCELACPAGIDIPGFIRLIVRSQFQEALAVIKRRTAFPGILGRICPRYCEKACRRGQYDESVSICALKRFPTDWCKAEGESVPVSAAPSGKTVCIIGGGFAGLSVAWFLMREGHQCHIYERETVLGGAVQRYIPEFRLPADGVTCEIDALIAMGLQTHMGSEIATAAQLNELSAQYDVVCLATGAPCETRAGFPGEDLCLKSRAYLSALKMETVSDLRD